MAKKEIYQYNKKRNKGPAKIEVFGKEYAIRTNEYFVNKALLALEKAQDEENSLTALNSVFVACAWLLTEEVVDEIAMSGNDVDWSDLFNVCFSLANGVDPDEYIEKVKEESKNE